MTTSALTQHQVIDFVASKNDELITNSLYSPDLSPCDMFLFSKIKNNIRYEQF